MSPKPLLILAAIAFPAFAQPPAPDTPASPPPPHPGMRERLKERLETKLADQMEIHRDLPYAPGAPANLPGAERQRLDLYLPKPDAAPTDKSTDKPADIPMCPVVIWVHGGAWEMGDKRPCPAAALTRDGFAVVSINYRFTSAAPFPAQIEDVKTAVRWIRAHAAEYHLDPTHIGAWGASAGGHLVALLGTSGGIKELEGASLGNESQDSRIQAVCDWFGPSDFTKMPGIAGTRPDSALHKLFDGSIAEKPELVKQASPVTFATSDDPPFLIMQGDKDPLVPMAQSEELEKILKDAGVRAELVVVQGAGHGFAGKEHGERVRDFFIRELKPKLPAPNP